MPNRLTVSLSSRHWPTLRRFSKSSSGIEILSSAIASVVSATANPPTCHADNVYAGICGFAIVQRPGTVPCLALYHCAQRHRRYLPVLQTVKFADSVEEIADSATSPEDLAVAAAELLHITTLLRRLPDSQREVVELRLQGLTDKEIAGILGKSHQAIRAAQHRALLQLRLLAGIDSRKDSGHVEGVHSTRNRPGSPSNWTSL